MNFYDVIMSPRLEGVSEIVRSSIWLIMGVSSSHVHCNILGELNLEEVK